MAHDKFFQRKRLIFAFRWLWKGNSSAAGLKLLYALTTEPLLKTYHLLPSVRGDLLAKLGNFREARTEFERAATLTRNARERDLLLERANACVAKIKGRSADEER